jgi:hypothetical protein
MAKDMKVTQHHPESIAHVLSVISYPDIKNLVPTQIGGFLKEMETKRHLSTESRAFLAEYGYAGRDQDIYRDLRKKARVWEQMLTFYESKNPLSALFNAAVFELREPLLRLNDRRIAKQKFGM